MATRRNEVFLATKVNNRSREGVLDELRQSLAKLQTDHVDLIQVHAVNAWVDLEQALAPDGAVSALEQARKEGLVRYIDEVVANAAAFRPLSDAERDELVESVRGVVEKDAQESQKGESKLFWLHDTTVMGWKQKDEPELVRY